MEIVGIEPKARELGASIRYIVVDGVVVRGSEEIRARVLNVVESFKSTVGGLEGLSRHPHVRAYRSLFWKMKVDPTKMRPSPEALARRVLRGRQMPMINNVVDAGNAASLATLVSIGLYDLDRVSGPLRVDVLDGGVFQPIGGGVAPVPRGMMGLVDAQGRILHLYAHRDSMLSMITSSTSRVLAVAYGAPGIDEDVLERSLLLFREILGTA